MCWLIGFNWETNIYLRQMNLCCEYENIIRYNKLKISVLCTIFVESNIYSVSILTHKLLPQKNRYIFSLTNKKPQNFSTHNMGKQKEIGLKNEWRKFDELLFIFINSILHFRSYVVGNCHLLNYLKQKEICWLHSILL